MVHASFQAHRQIKFILRQQRTNVTI